MSNWRGGGGVEWGRGGVERGRGVYAGGSRIGSCIGTPACDICGGGILCV